MTLPEKPTGQENGSRPAQAPTPAPTVRPRWRWVRPALLVAGLILSITFVLAFQFIPGQVQLNEGDVAKQNVRAPQKVTYVSQIKTREAKEKASLAVADVYDYDPGLAQQQKSKLDSACKYITSARTDFLSTPEQRRERIARLSDLRLSDKAITDTLAMGDSTWQSVCSEAMRVVDEVMRDRLRPGQLGDVKAKIPNRFVPALAAEQVGLATELANAYVKANETFNSEETTRQKRDAQAAVEPVRFSVEKQEIVIREGNVVTALDVEKLEALGLHKSAVEWPEILSMMLLAGVLVSLLSVYLAHYQPRVWHGNRRTVLLALLLVFTVAVAKATLPGRAGLVYVFPFAAVPMLVALLLDHQLGLLVTVFLSLLVGPIAENSLEITTISLAGGIIGVLSLRRLDRVSALLWSGLYVALTNYAVILAFHLPAGDYDVNSLLSLAATSVANGGISAAVVAIAVAPLGYLFGITTLIQLLELAHPSQPLFRKLLLQAPGTYHHSVLVASLSERGAEAIGEDTLLARVSAYYHDVGKALRPYFFIENQTEGFNVHDTMDPQVSARAIVNHVTDGVDLARQHRLPQEIVDTIQQHHGTRPTLYFYGKARRAAEATGAVVPVEPYVYPGPKPQTRLAALVMLADGVEATVRSEPNHSPEHIDRLVRQAVEERMADQLDESGLTLRDLEAIKRAFVGVLLGVYHPRLQYPPETPKR